MVLSPGNPHKWSSNSFKFWTFEKPLQKWFSHQEIHINGHGKWEASGLYASVSAGSFFGLPGLSQASAFVFYSVVILGRGM
jgi:hypothetical protein